MRSRPPARAARPREACALFHSHPIAQIDALCAIRAGRKSGPRAHTAGTSARTSSRRASRTRRPTRSPDPISSYWAAEAPALPTRSNPLEETLARIRDCDAPTPIVTATLGDLAGAVGATLWAAEQSPESTGGRPFTSKIDRDLPPRQRAGMSSRVRVAGTVRQWHSSGVDWRELTKGEVPPGLGGPDCRLRSHSEPMESDASIGCSCRTQTDLAYPSTKPTTTSYSSPAGARSLTVQEFLAGWCSSALSDSAFGSTA